MRLRNPFKGATKQQLREAFIMFMAVLGGPWLVYLYAVIVSH